jgi:NAD(P)H-dependent flavin oxidoreductase YrpB (nitropropane dioxygenase family)
MDQIGSVKAALRSVKAGVDIIIAQGVEAGGHVAGQATTMVLVPRIVEAIKPNTSGGSGWPNAPHRALRSTFVEQWLIE